jgi:ABC-type transport system involved in multi-copper enzyme maturation permease subunit
MSVAFYQSRVRQSFHRLPTLGLPLAFFFATLTGEVAMLLYSKFNSVPEMSPVRQLFVIPFFVGLGSIGRDASEGLLPVLLTRPLRRSTYVLAHWAALGTVASFWCLLHLLAQWGLIQLTVTHPPRLEELLFNGLGRVSLSFGMAAALVCFSTRLPAWGNVLLWGVLYYVADNVLPGLGKDESARYAFVVRQHLLGFLMPMLDFRQTFASSPISWFRLTTYLSNVSLLLLLGIYIFNRREVSYASR